MEGATSTTLVKVASNFFLTETKEQRVLSIVTRIFRSGNRQSLAALLTRLLKCSILEKFSTSESGIKTSSRSSEMNFLHFYSSISNVVVKYYPQILNVLQSCQLHESRYFTVHRTEPTRRSMNPN